MRRIVSVLLTFMMLLSIVCTVSATATASATTGATAAPTFSDVDATTNAGKAIMTLAQAGILSGDGDGTFRPNDGLSRAELCKVINKLFGYTEKDASGFTDVSVDAWYYDQVLIAKKAGYIKGYEDGTFRGNDKVTREQACVILVRVAGLTDNGKAVEIADNVAEWALSSVKLVIANGYMSLEEGNTFRATQNITRSEFSAAHVSFVGKTGTGTQTGTVIGGGTIGGGGNRPSGGSGHGGSGNGGSGNGGSGNDNTGDDNTGGDNTDDEKEEPVDYEAVNAAMVEKLNIVIHALDENNPEGFYGLFKPAARKNIIDPIIVALKDAIAKSASNVIDEDFIRKEYDGEDGVIDDIYDYYLGMSDSDLMSFQEAIGIVDETTYGALTWIAAQFGLL